MGKKGGGPNSANEFLYKLSQKYAFKKDIFDTRVQIGIPKDGLGSWDEAQEWIVNHPEKAFDLTAADFYFQKKYKISVAFLPQLSHYIFLSKPAEVPRDVPVAIEIKEQGNLAELYDSLGEPYVKLYILDNNSKSTVLSFIDRNWKKIETSLRKQRGEKPRIRTRTIVNKELIENIKAFWKEDIRDLQAKAESNSRDRDILIAKILGTKPEYVRKIAGGQDYS